MGTTSGSCSVTLSRKAGKMPTFRELIEAADTLSDLLDVTWKKGDRSGEVVSDDLDSANHIINLGGEKDGAVSLLRTVARSSWLRGVRNSALRERQAMLLAAAETALAKALEPQATVSAEGQ